jgi:RHS repeat-associated protein
VFDGEAGLHYNYHREYDPAVGRYVESDPIGFAGGSYATYAYVAGDPLKYIDSLGLKPCPVTLPGVGRTYLDDSLIPAVQRWVALNQAQRITLNFTEAFRTTTYQQSLANNPNATTPATAAAEFVESLSFFISDEKTLSRMQPILMATPLETRRAIAADIAALQGELNRRKDCDLPQRYSRLVNLL